MRISKFIFYFISSLKISFLKSFFFFLIYLFSQVEQDKGMQRMKEENQRLANQVSVNFDQYSITEFLSMYEFWDVWLKPKA